MYIVRYNRLIHLNQYCKPFTNIYNYFCMILQLGPIRNSKQN